MSMRKRIIWSQQLVKTLRRKIASSLQHSSLKIWWITLVGGIDLQSMAHYSIIEPQMSSEATNLITCQCVCVSGTGAFLSLNSLGIQSEVCYWSIKAHRAMHNRTYRLGSVANRDTSDAQKVSFPRNIVVGALCGAQSDGVNKQTRTDQRPEWFTPLSQFD